MLSTAAIAISAPRTQIRYDFDFISLLSTDASMITDLRHGRSTKRRETVPQRISTILKPRTRSD
jgi:hypothetical protein